ncbi:neuropeptide-like precursor 1 [Ostrinia nubilalis]|uniref:neuropeptide-like precursor 1 n=1 Tax=Ostrinia furnacalis TaxID=93504 RepID=UPI00103A0038|nr:neuropeptide-like precursor 1 [Ostrinia furnacalis]
MGITRNGVGRHRGCIILVAFVALAFSSTYVEQVTSLPVDASSQWPTFPRRNIAALARDGYLKNGSPGFKRSISTLAKNGQLPTYRSPYDETDRQEQDDEESHEKRNMASIARLRSYAAMKRNIQALARDGYRVGRGQYNQPNDKRNIAALARNGLIHKKAESNGDEYYYPFYQNPIPPLSEMDGPFDLNEMYDLQQSINPDMFPPLSRVYKRDVYGGQALNDFDEKQLEMDDNWYYKRGSLGLPVHGLFRPIYTDPTARTKRYILSLPDVIDNNEIHVPENDDGSDDKRSVDEDMEVRDNFEKRHIGSLARLGLLPSFRFSGGRYSRSGRARLLLPSQEMYRKHSSDENFGIREYLTSAEADAAIDSDDSDLPPPAVPAYSHPTGRLLHRPLNNDLPINTRPLAPPPIPNLLDSFSKNSWHSKDSPRFYHFRSLKIPYHTSDKRYLLLPAVDNFLLRKAYRNSSLPGRRKNQ